jgi:hypothetical protein
MPSIIYEHEGLLRCYHNKTTTRMTPNILLFTVKKVRRFWWLIPERNCPEYIPLHKTKGDAIQHYWVAGIF